MKNVEKGLLALLRTQAAQHPDKKLFGGDQ